MNEEETGFDKGWIIRVIITVIIIIGIAIYSYFF